MAVTRHFSIIMCQASNFYRLDAHMEGAIEGDFFRLVGTNFFWEGAQNISSGGWKFFIILTAKLFLKISNF